MRLYHVEHWPVGTIARQLRVHHATVRRALRAAGVEVAPRIVRVTMIDPYRAFIVETLTKYPSLRASRLYAMVKAPGLSWGAGSLPRDSFKRVMRSYDRSVTLDVVSKAIANTAYHERCAGYGIVIDATPRP